MKKYDTPLTFDPYNRSFTYTIVLVSYCLRVLSMSYLTSIYGIKMNKPKKTTILD